MITTELPSHYEDLFNYLKKDRYKLLLQKVDYEIDKKVSHSDIVQFIQGVKDSKSCDLDAEHLKH